MAGFAVAGAPGAAHDVSRRVVVAEGGVADFAGSAIAAGENEVAVIVPIVEAGRPGAAADVAQDLPRDMAVDVAVGEAGAAEEMAAHGQAGKIALAGVSKGEMQAVGGDAYQRTRGVAKGSVHQLAEAEEEGRAGNEQEENAWQAGRLVAGRDG